MTPNFHINWSLWKLAFRNLLRNARRSLATGAAIVFGFVGLVLLGAHIYTTCMGLMASTVYINKLGHIAIRKANSLDRFTSKPSRYVLNLEDQAKIAQAIQPWSDEIEFTGRFLSGAALLTDGKHSTPIFISGVEPEIYRKLLTHPFVKRWAPDWGAPDADSKMAAMTANDKLISITSRVAERISRGTPLERLSPSDRQIQILAKNYFGDLNAVDAELGLEHTTGIAFAEDTSTVTSLKLLQDLYSTDGVEYLSLFLKNRFATNRISRDLQNRLGPGFEIWTYDDESWAPYYVGTMNFLYVMGVFFAILILGAVSLTIVNTTTLNLLERIREIGTLRAIGFSPSDMRASFMREAGLLTVFALIIGQGLALVIAAVVNILDIRYQPPSTSAPIQFRLTSQPVICVLFALVVLMITLASTQIVVRRKSHLKVIDLLIDTGA